MGNIADTSLFSEEFEKEMEDFFEYLDHEVLGKPKEELEVEETTDEEAEYWEMKAEIHNGI